jgi:NAD(P)-dependent dehydrogenase (short-subunit alcohol dehydrogenase family)
VSWHGDALDMTNAEVERLVAVNLLGVIHGSRAAAAVMRWPIIVGVPDEQPVARPRRPPRILYRR